MIPNEISTKLKNALGHPRDMITVRAPGRINLIGEHTDYNKGLVLSGAIDKYMYFSCIPNKSSIVNAHAIDREESLSFEINDAENKKYLWADFLTGILLQFKKNHPNISGFDCAFTSEIPMGAGMSSSSALECAFLVGLKELYNLSLDNWDMINMSQDSNHNYLGIKGGILDQFTSLFGQENKIMLLDCDTNSFRYIDAPKSNYQWLLINTCVKHNHINSGYNDRVKECNNALRSIQAHLPEVKHLSALKSIAELESVHFKNGVEEKRATYIIEENNRVLDFVNALDRIDYVSCGQLLYASHDGLSNKYEVSCPELDYLVDLFKSSTTVLGSRMMGGGFGGCTLNLVLEEALPQVKEEAYSKYLEKFGREPEFYDVVISGGAGVI